jgi:release factor glutamine methyltransferase
LTVKELLHKYNNQLPRHEMEILIAYHLSCDRLWVLSHPEAVIAEGAHKLIVESFHKLIDNVPLAYIVGYKRFYDADYFVDPRVLIPRQETEELVSVLVSYLQTKKQPMVIADIGTGSGCIGLTLARLVPKHQYYLIDVSTDALIVAQKNADALIAPTSLSQVQFFHGNLLDPIKGDLPQLIVANLPYLSAALMETVPTNVGSHEPHLALYGGEDGFALYRELLSQVASKYQSLPWPEMWWEISPEQVPLIPGVFLDSYPLPNIEVVPDLNERDRFVHVSF